MYRFSRAIYRELADLIEDDEAPREAHARVLAACERAIERLACDRHYFARPARTLFQDIRIHFPMTAQSRVLAVCERYLRCADEFLAARPPSPVDLAGNPVPCRATTRKGTACARTPLARNGYCPSHQHLAETESVEAEGAVAA